MIKKVIVMLIIAALLLLAVGCEPTNPEDANLAIVIGRIDNTLHLKNLGSTRNDSEKWTLLHLDKDTTPEYREEAIKMEFKSGDTIMFIGKGLNGWHDINKIVIVDK